MVLSVGADGVTGGAHLPGELRVGSGAAPHHEEDGACAFRGERPEHVLGVRRHRTVVEREHDLAGRERQGHAVVVAADQRHGAGVDGQGPADTERVGIRTSRRRHGGNGERGGARDQGQAAQDAVHGGENIVAAGAAALAPAIYRPAGAPFDIPRFTMNLDAVTP